MKNKILLFLITIGIAFAITPLTVNAASLNAVNEKYFKIHHPYYMEKVSKYHISAVGTDLDLYKQAALEDIDAIYNESQGKTYDPNIKVIIAYCYIYVISFFYII